MNRIGGVRILARGACRRKPRQAVTAIGSITGRIRRIGNATTSISAAVEEQGAAAGQVPMAASELSRQSEHLGAEVARFLAAVRVA